MAIKLSRIACTIKPSATIAAATRAKQMVAEGIDVISFGLGEPDFDTPKNIKIAAVKAIESGFTKYTPTAGIPDLKEAICEKLKRDNGLEYKPSEVIVSCGGKHSLYNMMMALCDPGDEVIIPAPYWVTYPDQAVMTGATPIILPTTDAQGFKITRDQLAANITPRSKVLIMNSPSNPTGMAYTEEEMRAVVGLAVEKGLLVISDEMYEKTIYDGLKHVSPAAFGPEFKERVITVNGMSKSYAMTGWRLGYAAGPEEVVKAATCIQDQVTSGPNSITQKAAVEGLRGDQSAVAQMVAEFDKRRKYIVGRLNAMRDITCVMPQGAFYAFPNVSKWYGRKAGSKTLGNSFEFCDYLLEKARIAAVPGQPFGAPPNIRFSYATSMEKITEGMNRMEEALKNA